MASESLSNVSLMLRSRALRDTKFFHFLVNRVASTSEHGSGREMFAQYNIGADSLLARPSSSVHGTGRGIVREG